MTTIDLGAIIKPSKEREVASMKRRKVVFEYRGQMVNYYNKVLKNKKIGFATCGYDVEEGAYTVEYEFKKN